MPWIWRCLGKMKKRRKENERFILDVSSDRSVAAAAQIVKKDTGVRAVVLRGLFLFSLFYF